MPGALLQCTGRLRRHSVRRDLRLCSIRSDTYRGPRRRRYFTLPFILPRASFSREPRMVSEKCPHAWAIHLLVSVAIIGRVEMSSIYHYRSTLRVLTSAELHLFTIRCRWGRYAYLLTDRFHRRDFITGVVISHRAAASSMTVIRNRLNNNVGRPAFMHGSYNLRYQLHLAYHAH